MGIIRHFGGTRRARDSETLTTPRDLGGGDIKAGMPFRIDATIATNQIRKTRHAILPYKSWNMQNWFKGTRRANRPSLTPVSLSYTFDSRQDPTGTKPAHANVNRTSMPFIIL